MKRPDGSLCRTPGEISEVSCDHFRAPYNRQPRFDKSILNDLPQHQIFEEFDHLPTDKEIISTAHKLNTKSHGKSGESWRN